MTDPSADAGRPGGHLPGHGADHDHDHDPDPDPDPARHDAFELIARSLPTVSGDELDQLVARATQVARNAICITDADLDVPGPRIVYVNPAFEHMTGYTAAEVLGHHPRFLQGPRSDRTVLDRLRADLEAGRPFQGETVNYRKDGTPFQMSWRIAAVRDPEGRTTHFVAAQEDLSLLREAEQQLRDDAEHLLADSEWLGDLVGLGVDLARASSPEDVLERVVGVAIDRLGAESAGVVLLDDERGDWVVAASRGDDQPEPGDRYDPEPDSLVARALGRRSPVIEDGTDAPIGAGLGCPACAVAVLPLGDAEPYGAIVVGWRTVRRFRGAQRHHLALLGRLTTMTHRKTQALADQRSLAGELQAALLPALGDLPGLEAAWRYRSVADHAVVGGDWYDAVALGDGRVALFVGDVVGHGARAAALMGELRFTTRGLLRAYADPAELTDELDRALLAAHPPGEALATMCAVLIDPDGTLHHCSAGHPHPVIRRADGRIDVLRGARTRLLGASADGEPRVSATDRLEVGDTLIAFSDGVFETRDEDYDDTYRALLTRLDAAVDDPDALCDAALALGTDTVDHAGAPFRDDVVVLAVRRRPPA